jgi:hypothetical protein
MNPKLLVVGMANSIHVARWLAQLDGLGWDLHLVPSVADAPAHAALRGVTIHAPRLDASSNDPLAQARHLARTIDELSPDLVHSIELQHAGYLTLAARGLVTGPFPRWMVTNWGNDIFLFGRLPAHVPRIRAILAGCQYYSCEAERDVRLAREYGFTGESWPVMPNTGGIDLPRVEPWRQAPTSSRRTIVVKGYQGFMGRALVAIEALRRCADVLREYRIVVYSAHTQDVEVATELLREDCGLNVRRVIHASHDEMMRLHGSARVYMGLSISDGASTSMLEALAMGALPIQSNTASADEWLVHGETGFVVPPEDPAVVADALRRALTDDALVDAAAERNAQVAATRLNCRTMRPRVVTLYERMFRREPLTLDDVDDAVGVAATAARAAVNGAHASPPRPAPREPYNLDHVQRVAILGSGPNYGAARELSMRCGWNIAYCIDNNPATWGRHLDGIVVSTPTRLAEERVDLVIVASDAHRQPMMEQLDAMGFEAGVSQIWFRSAVQIGGTCVQVR